MHSGVESGGGGGRRRGGDRVLHHFILTIFISIIFLLCTATPGSAGKDDVKEVSSTSVDTAKECEESCQRQRNFQEKLLIFSGVCGGICIVGAIAGVFLLGKRVHVKDMY